MPGEPHNLSNRFIFPMLGSRLVLFLLFQALVALLLNSWEKSEKYWLLTATLTNLATIALLYYLFRREGENYFSIFRINRTELKRDIKILLGIILISGPVVFAPGYFLSKMIWNDPVIPTEMMFGPIENWLVYILLFAFPVTIVVAELATYFIYIMPRLKDRFGSKWIAILLPVLFLSLQHCTLPFIPDLRFIIYRALVFLPLALLLGITIYYRPTLFPYLAFLHGLMDMGAAFMFLLELN